MPKSAQINLEELEKLAQLHCTYEELAAYFRCDRRTIIRHMKKPAVAEAFERGKAAGLLSLRRAQFAAALKGDRTMLVWLGKQLLGQSDQVTQKHEGSIAVNDSTATRELLLSKLNSGAATGSTPRSDQRVN